MMIRAIRFNLYLFAGVSLFLGCESSPEAKHQQEVSTLRLHLEAPREQDDRSLEIKISRGHPIPIRVLNDSFLDEAYVSKAEVVDDGAGGYQLQIQFNRHGSWMLEQHSAGNQGKHLAVFSEFRQPSSEVHESRWLAAPKITRRITDGKLTFTPDATREEAEQIVHGLMNVARKHDEPSKW